MYSRVIRWLPFQQRLHRGAEEGANPFSELIHLPLTLIL